MRRPLSLALGPVLVVTWAALAAAAPGPAAALAAGPLLVPRVDRPLRVDDFADLAPSAEIAAHVTCLDGFRQRSPRDGQPTTLPTRACLARDATTFYVAHLATVDDPGTIRAHWLRRDETEIDDWVNVTLDTFNDQRRAYTFGSNALGVQWDAVWTEGAGHDKSVDLLYRTDARITAHGFIVLFTIPFSTLRTPGDGPQTWRLMLGRGIQARTEEAFWPAFSSRVEGRLNQAAPVALEDGPARPSPLQVIPYASSRAASLRDAPAPPARHDLAGDVGFDAKAILGNSIVVDATANPDFSQVESDAAQVTVNQRFEVFFPEKRPFFLENAGYFATPLDLVFTRRMAAPDVGLRVTGKSAGWAFGGMAVGDGAPAEGRAAFAVGRVSRDLGKQSSIGALVTSRSLAGRANRVAALDGRVKLAANWTTTWQAAASTQDDGYGASRSGKALLMTLQRTSRRLTSDTRWLDIGRAFGTDVGFVPRTDIRSAQETATWRFHPEGRRLFAWGPNATAQAVWDHAGTRLDWVRTAGLASEWARQTFFTVEATRADLALRPGDVPGVTEVTTFPTSRVHATFETWPTPAFNVSVNAYRGRDLMVLPAAGLAPRVAEATSATLTAGWRPVRRFSGETSWLYTRLGDAAAPILTNQVLRTRWYLQITPRLAVRTIMRADLTRADATQTRLPEAHAINADLLVSYIVNPWTALYVGYNGNGRLVERDAAGRLAAPWLRDAQQVFVKWSYLWRM